MAPWWSRIRRPDITHDSPARAQEETAAPQTRQPIDERKHDEPVKQVEEQVPAAGDAVNEVVSSKLPTTDDEPSVGDADEDTSTEPKTVARMPIPAPR